MKVSIIIPAYNEEHRIKNTLITYDQFYRQKQHETNLEYELLVMINGTTDKTLSVVKDLQKSMPNLRVEEIKQGGKGLAIRYGFKNSLQRQNDLIGFVDADMATCPEMFYQLIKEINGEDGIIASRYMPGSLVVPPRPFIKRWGSKIFFESLTSLLFGLHYYDTQCGAKLFKRHTIEKIVPFLSVPQWAFDIELLYLHKCFGFNVKEVPTNWHDKTGSKLRLLHAGLPMLGTLIKLRYQYWLKNF